MKKQGALLEWNWTARRIQEHVRTGAVYILVCVSLFLCFSHVAAQTVVTEDWTLEDDTTLPDDLVLEGGTLRLNGHRLHVAGAFRHTGGTLQVGGGQLVVEGDYLIQGADADDERASGHADSEGRLNMTHADDRVLVMGRFVMQSNRDHYYNLTAGIFEVRGDFYQWLGNEYNFVAFFAHRVLLSGGPAQQVFFETPDRSGFANASITNPDIELLSPLRGWRLHESLYLGRPLHHGFVGELDLNGHLMLVDGDFLQSASGTINVNRGLLMVNGSLVQGHGQIRLNNGAAAVLGDYRLQRLVVDKNDVAYDVSAGLLTMTGPYDYVMVDGDFVVQSTRSHTNNLTAGVLEIRGDFLQMAGSSSVSFNARNSHTTLFTGVTPQHIYFDAPSGSGFARVLFGHEDIHLLSVVRGWELEEDVVVASCQGFTGTMNLNGHSLTVEGDMTQADGTVNLNGGALEVKGNLLQPSGTINVGNSSLVVHGDYRIQRIAEADEKTEYEASSGRLTMTHEEGRVLVWGDFIMHSTLSHSNNLTAGVLELRGDFYQLAGHSGNFQSRHDHRVVFAGGDTQTVSFETPTGASLAFCSIVNSDIVFASPVPGFTLEEDVVIASAQGFTGTMNLAGYTLTIRGDMAQVSGAINLNGGVLDVGGNLLQPSGRINVDTGALVVRGDYRIQDFVEDEEGDKSAYGPGSGILNMTNAAGQVFVHGDFYTQSTSSHYYNLTAGLLVLRGDFHQLAGHSSNFQARSQHRVEIAGDRRQRIHFSNPSVSGFNLVTITNPDVHFASMAKGFVLLDDAVINNPIDHGFLGTLNLNNKTLEVLDRVVQLGSGTIDLNQGLLRINGDFIQATGTLRVNRGRLEVQGDYRIQRPVEEKTVPQEYENSSGYLTMTNAADHVLVHGDFYMQSSNSHYYHLTAGTLELRGSFFQLAGNSSNFRARNAHRLLFAGDGVQTVYFENPTSASWAYCTVLNPEVVFDTLAPGFPLDGDITLATARGFAGTMNLNGHGLTVAGDMVHDNGTITLNGGALTVGGDLLQPGGRITVGDGTLTVQGNYRIQSRVVDKGEVVYGESSGYLSMTDPGGHALVHGDFYTQSSNSHYYHLTAGTLEVKSAFYQLAGNSASFRARGDHRVIFSGEDVQTVYFENPTGSSLAYCTIANDQTSFISEVPGFPLDADATLSAPLGFAGNMDLNGHTLTATGDVVQGSGTVRLSGGAFIVQGTLLQPAGTLNISGGSLLIEGDYRIQSIADKSDEMVYEASSGYLSMTNGDDYVLIHGNFYTQSSQSHYYHLTAGTLELRGDFYQLAGNSANYNARNNHQVVLSGEERQHIAFDRPDGSGFHQALILNPDIVFASTLRGFILLEDAHVSNTISYGFRGEMNLNGNTLHVAGDFEQPGSGTIRLGGGRLLVTGDLIQGAGEINVEGGIVRVNGDYRIQSRELSDDVYIYSDSAGTLRMTNSADYVLVGGAFITQSTQSHYYLLTNGLLDVRGDFEQLLGSGSNFQARSSHKTAFAGAGAQSIAFEHATSPYFATMIAVNNVPERITSSTGYNVSDTVSAATDNIVATLAAGASAQFDISFDGVGAVWASLNAEVAAVSETGLVTAVTPGMALLKAAHPENENLFLYALVEVTPGPAKVPDGGGTTPPGADGDATDESTNDDADAQSEHDDGDEPVSSDDGAGAGEGDASDDDDEGSGTAPGDQEGGPDAAADQDDASRCGMLNGCNGDTGGAAKIREILSNLFLVGLSLLIVITVGKGRRADGGLF